MILTNCHVGNRTNKCFKKKMRDREKRKIKGRERQRKKERKRKGIEIKNESERRHVRRIFLFVKSGPAGILHQ